MIFHQQRHGFIHTNTGYLPTQISFKFIGQILTIHTMAALMRCRYDQCAVISRIIPHADPYIIIAAQTQRMHRIF